MRLLQLESDRRFDTSYVCVGRGQDAIAALPVYEPQVPRWPDQAYDVGRIFGAAGAAHGWALLGGRADQQSAALVSATAEKNAQAAALAAVVGAAVAETRSRGRRAGAVFVDEALLDAAVRAERARSIVVGNRAVLRRVGVDLESYVAALDADKRRKVRRDLRLLESFGIAAAELEWADVVDEVAPLIAQKEERYGNVDHPLLVADRLAQWTANPELECVAFAIRSGGRLVGASLGWTFRRTLYMYELGLSDALGEQRALAYAELGFYAPLRRVWAAGLSAIDLGLDSAYPKRRRGAEFSSVHAFRAP